MVLTQSIKNVIVISSDTDVLVLLIHYFRRFNSEGLQKMWLRVGKKENRRFIPIHTVSDRIGSSLTQTLLKAHIGTGCDYISKVGTKHGALKASPELYLQSFGEGDHLTDDQIINPLVPSVALLQRSILSTNGLYRVWYSTTVAVVQIGGTSADRTTSNY